LDEARSGKLEELIGRKVSLAPSAVSIGRATKGAGARALHSRKRSREEARRRVNPTIVLLAVAAANAGIAMRVVEPMLPRLATEFATTVPAAAAVISAFAFAQAGAQYFHGPLGDRFGKLRVLTVLMVLSAVASFGCASAGSLDGLLAWRVATGLFSSATMTLGMAFIGDAVPSQRRQTVLARFISGTIIGQGLGPLIGGAMTDLAGWRAAFVLLGAVFAAVAAVLFAATRRQWGEGTRSAGPLLSPARHLAILRIPRARAVLLSVFLEMVFFYGAFAFLGALLKAQFDLPFTIIGLLLAGFGLGGLLYTFSVRWLLTRIGQRGCVQLGGALGGVFYLAIVLAPAWPLVAICTLGLGFAFYAMHNTLQMKATEMAPQSRATALSLFSMFWAGGQAAGAALMGGAVAAFGLAPMIVCFGIGYALLGVGLRHNLQRLGG
jgi:predicted MFS family arabinose efflux permease